MPRVLHLYQTGTEEAGIHIGFFDKEGVHREGLSGYEITGLSWVYKILPDYVQLKKHGYSIFVPYHQQQQTSNLVNATFNSFNFTAFLQRGFNRLQTPPPVYLKNNMNKRVGRVLDKPAWMVDVREFETFYMLFICTHQQIFILPNH